MTTDEMMKILHTNQATIESLDGSMVGTIWVAKFKDGRMGVGQSMADAIRQALSDPLTRIRGGTP